MKALTLFNTFDWLSFSKDKELVVTGCAEWQDYKTHQHMGTRVYCVIAKDNTRYFYHGENVVGLNEYERFSVKVPKNISVDRGSRIALVNPRATVYGQFNNNISITADDVKVINQKEDK